MISSGVNFGSLQLGENLDPSMRSEGPAERASAQISSDSSQSFLRVYNSIKDSTWLRELR